MSPGEDEVSLACLAVNSAADYENLSALDVLGLADNAGQESNVMGEFKEQLIRSDEGWYETALPWSKSSTQSRWQFATATLSFTETWTNKHVSRV